MMVSLMPEPHGKITHVSDTALMIAACRAHENELEDAFVRDPFAARLAGDRAFAILNAMPHANVMRLGMAVRTRFVDELLQQAPNLPDPDCVERRLRPRYAPWRLDLAPDLRWIEIEFADVLDYKDQHMQTRDRAAAVSASSSISTMHYNETPCMRLLARRRHS
jgi:O-methyltransferase involved in polyketide biosynthesis